MKILHIINNLGTGGAEKLLLEAIPLYNLKGLEIDVLLLNGTEFPFYKQLLEKKCCNIYHIGKGSVYNPLHIFRIIPYLKKYKLVHVHLFPALYWVVFAKLFSFSNPKLVFTEHNTTNRRFKNKFFKIIDKLIYQYYSKIVCISNEVYVITKKYTDFSENRFCIIENGISIRLISIGKIIDKKDIHLLLKKNDRLLIQVSRFQEQKDQKTLIKAMKLLPERIKLLLVGNGNKKEECESLVDDLDLKKRVFFLGVRTDVPDLLKSSDIVVLSSKYEGLSLSSIEGMASGKPFIASDVPGLRDVVKGAGILFKQGNSDELANHILKCLNDAKYYKTIAKQCLERANKYDISSMVSKHIQLYKLLNQKK